MHARLRHRYALVGFKLLVLVAFLAGCGQPVREDRSINWSKEGSSVGFQLHDRPLRGRHVVGK